VEHDERLITVPLHLFRTPNSDIKLLQGCTWRNFGVNMGEAAEGRNFYVNIGRTA
jgi:hypothetical protein